MKKALWIVLLAAVPTAAFADAKAIGWDPAYNRYFGVELTNPDYPQMRDALASRLNRRTLDNVHPQSEFSAFKSYLKDTPGTGGKKLKAGIVQDLYDNMADYLELEAHFEGMYFKDAIAKAAEIVKYQSYTAPDWDYEYPNTLMDVMAKRKMLVPSTVLFNVYLNPFRPVAWPVEGRLMETQFEPSFERSSYTMRVVIPLPQNRGPVARLDFETIHLGGLVVEASADGTDYRGIMHITSQEESGILAPVLFQAPISAPYLRLTATSPTDQAMLREFKLYTLELGE